MVDRLSPGRTVYLIHVLPSVTPELQPGPDPAATGTLVVDSAGATAAGVAAAGATAAGAAALGAAAAAGLVVAAGDAEVALAIWVTVAGDVAAGSGRVTAAWTVDPEARVWPAGVAHGTGRAAREDTAVEPDMECVKASAPTAARTAAPMSKR
jgi:hypothetical protein